jgi:hypothetical protein
LSQKQPGPREGVLVFVAALFLIEKMIHNDLLAFYPLAVFAMRNGCARQNGTNHPNIRNRASQAVGIFPPEE